VLEDIEARRVGTPMLSKESIVGLLDPIEKLKDSTILTKKKTLVVFSTGM
jgi:hypothetical protein